MITSVYIDNYIDKLLKYVNKIGSIRIRRAL